MCNLFSVGLDSWRKITTSEVLQKYSNVWSNISGLHFACSTMSSNSTEVTKVVWTARWYKNKNLCNSKNYMSTRKTFKASLLKPGSIISSIKYWYELSLFLSRIYHSWNEIVQWLEYFHTNTHLLQQNKIKKKIKHLVYTICHLI